MAHSRWDKPRILSTLRKLHRSGAELSYNALARSMQSLVSASAYHFGSYRSAIEHAGIDYADVLRRPRWTKLRIIQLIKAARKRGENLHWAAVTQRRDELGKAAFASLQSRLFGRWDRALQGAGLDADDVSQYRRWDPSAVAFELKCRARESEPMNSGAIQRDDPGLHAAAVRHFGGYDKALRAAKLDPAKVRQRRRWSPEDILKQLHSWQETRLPGSNGSAKRDPEKRGGERPGRHGANGQARGKLKSGAADRHGKSKLAVGRRHTPSISAASLRREHTALYSAAVRLFGSIAAARDAAVKAGKSKLKAG